MAARVKNIIFIIILTGLLLPGLQSIFHLFPERELHGAYEKEERPELNSDRWFNEEFQQAMVPWLEEHIGFHNGLVRMNNQLDYTFFHKANAEGVIRGRNGNLFEYDYIKAWTGKDFIGEKLLDKKLRGFRFLQQHLKEQFDIDLVLVLEPGKASIYPEDIPERFTKAKAGKSNYDYIRMRATELEINLIDLNEWFSHIKDTSTYPLFPPQGTHWSEFAMWYAADSLINYIEQSRDIRLPEVIVDSIEYSSDLRSTDYDQGVTLNLLFELEHGEMPYPAFHFEEKENQTRPKVLAIADSYYWNIYNTRIPKYVFAQEAFWYFYNLVFPHTYYSRKFFDKERTISDLDLKKEIEKQDVILYMATERFLYMFDRGFVDDLIKIYGPTSCLDELTFIKTKILVNQQWFNDVIDRADRSGITIEERLDLEADYVLWNDKPEMHVSIYGPGSVIGSIESDESWMAQIRERAKEEGQDLDERLIMEARYMLDQDHPEALEKYDAITEYSLAIRSDTAWYRKVMEKAARFYLTEEEMIRVEAERLYEMRSER
jgi:hypothetical protein